MVYRIKARTIIISIILLSLLNFAYYSGMKLINNSTYVTPILFGGITFFLYCAFLIYYLNRISNASVDQEISSMNNATIFINNNRIVLDMNETMLDTFKLKKDEFKGFSISDISHEIFVSIDIILDGFTRMNSFDISIDNVRKHYKVGTSIVNDKKLRKVGKLITLVDITDVGIDDI